MSVTVMARVFWTDIPSLSYQNKQGKKVGVDNKSAKLTLLAIADNADDFGENSWQSFDTLAQKTGLERRSVIRVIHALITNGFCKLNGITRYGTNDYAINLKKLGFPPEKRAKTGRPKSSDSGAESSDSGAESGDSGAESSDPESPESSLSSSEPKHDLLDGILEAELLAILNVDKSWRGRELLPEYLLVYGDWWHSKTGLHFYGKKSKPKVDKGSIKEFNVWYEEELTISALCQSYDIDIAWKKIISKPAEITAKARAIQAHGGLVEIPKENQGPIVRRDPQPIRESENGIPISY